MADSKKISSRVIETKMIDWQSIQFLTLIDFKKISDKDYTKLRASIIQNNFIEPLIVWYQAETDIIFCLNGKYRIDCLKELLNDGYKVPDLLPAAFIKCNNRKEAAHLQLLYSTVYARYDMDSLFDFIDSFELEYQKIDLDICLPNIDWDTFVGHRLKDFSHDNQELDPNDFTDEMKLVFAYPKETYLDLRTRLAELAQRFNVDTIEEVLTILIYEKVPL